MTETKDGREVRTQGLPLPAGCKDERCPDCGGKLTGALISPTADEADPDIFCPACGYYRC